MTDIISFPPKLSKLSHAKLAQLSSEEFANIRESIKKEIEDISIRIRFILLIEN